MCFNKNSCVYLVLQGRTADPPVTPWTRLPGDPAVDTGKWSGQWKALQKSVNVRR